MSDEQPNFWPVGEGIQPSPVPGATLWNPELWETVEEEIDTLDASLRQLSLDIHGKAVRSAALCLVPRLTLPQGHPELSFKEKCVDDREIRSKEFLTICSHSQDARMTS